MSACISPTAAQTTAERRFLADSGTLSEVGKTALDGALAPTPTKRSLIELQAVDDAYPLYGQVALKPSLPLEQALKDQGGTFGAAAEAAAASRLGM